MLHNAATRPGTTFGRVSPTVHELQTELDATKTQLFCTVQANATMSCERDFLLVELCRLDAELKAVRVKLANDAASICLAQCELCKLLFFK